MCSGPMIPVEEPTLEEPAAEQTAHELRACGGDCPECQRERSERREISAAADVCERALETMVDEVQDDLQRREDFGPNGDGTTPGFFKEQA